MLDGVSSTSSATQAPPPPPPPPPLAPRTTPVSGYGTQVSGQSFQVCGTGQPCSAPPVASWGSQPVGSAYRNTWETVSAQLGTTNPIAIRSEIDRQLYQTQGLDGYRFTSTQFSTTTPTNTTAQTPPPADGPDPVQLGLDLTQMALDITGIVEPTPFSDGANTVISIGRGIGSLFSGNWGEAGGHGLNGVLSAVGIIPYLGDAAKLGKIAKWAQTVADAVSAVARNPALRSTLEPGLRAIRDAVNSIPQSALDSLPTSARESIEGMKRQLDEFFSGATNAATTANRMENGTLVLGANRGATTTVNGRTVTIGETPTVTSANGRYTTTDVAGNSHTLRQPATFDSRVVNADGTVTYTKGTRSVTYDANGFPVFNAKADLHLDVSHINSADSAAHFRAANEQLGNALRADPSLASQMGLNQAQVDHILRGGSTSPPGLTWHHHQDAGRMQLVDRLEHNHFSGGHTGGMALWGGGR